MPDAEQVATDKQALRRHLLAGRRARSEPDRTAARVAIDTHLWPHLLRRRVVCAYLPLPTEPLPPALLDRLTAAGVRVLVPVVAADGPLDWTDYPAPTTSGPFGIAEPVGRRLGASAVIGADVVLIPALAVDPAGHRLGRGGGHYDRSLALLPVDPVGTGVQKAELIAVLFDDELSPAVPFDGHDITVDAVVTPDGGLVRLRR